MGETPQQYTQRIVSTLGERNPLEVLAETPQKLADVVKSRPEEAFAKRPTQDKWSVGEILAHLADAEMVIGFRVRLVLGQPGVPIQAFDQDVWAQFSHYDRIRVEESLQRLAVQRHANLRLLRSLTSEKLQKYGVHSERGQETEAHMIRMRAGHDLNRRAQIERSLGLSAAA